MSRRGVTDEWVEERQYSVDSERTTTHQLPRDAHTHTHTFELGRTRKRAQCEGRFNHGDTHLGAEWLQRGGRPRSSPDVLRDEQSER